MANNIALQTLMASTLDEALVADVKTRAMEANANSVKYNGGNKFQYAKISFGNVDKLDYDRSAGFESGDVTLNYETKEFKKDWGKVFTIDAMDVDETNFIETASLVLKEAERTVFAPAVDKFRFEEFVKLAKANTAKGAIVEAYTIAATGVLKQLRAAFSKAMTGTGLTESDLLCYVSRSFYNALVDDKDVQKVANVAGGQVNVNGQVKSVDGVAIEVVDDERIGKNVHYIVCAKTAPIAIIKHNVSKIIAPDANPLADGYRVAVRLYHTLEIKDNQYPSVVVGMTTTD